MAQRHNGTTAQWKRRGLLRCARNDRSIEDGKKDNEILIKYLLA